MVVQPRKYYHTSIAFIVLAVICFALDIAGVTTALITIDDGSSETVVGSGARATPQHVTTSGSVTLWQSCSKQTAGTVSQETCSNVDDAASGCTLDRVKAMRAFGILSILIAFFICICAAVADLVGVLPWHMSRWVLAAAAFFLMLFQLIYWAIMAGLWNTGCGDQTAFRNVSGSKYGPSGPLFIVSWILSLVMMALPVAEEVVVHDKVVNEPAHHHVVATDPAMRPVGTAPAPYSHTTAVTVPR